MFFDTHCHIDFDDFNDDREQVLDGAAASGVTGLLVPGITLAQSSKLLKFNTRSKINIFKAIGLHPYFMSAHKAGDFRALAQLAVDNKRKLVAIGECGIDRSIDNLALQQSLFQQHIELANQLALPLVVHHRQSHDLIAQAFKAVKPLFGGIIHAFSGSQQVANYYIEQGFKLGVGGTISYPRAQKTREVIRSMALEYLVLETDAPAMPLFGYQGLRNEPQRLVRVFNCLCDLKEVDTDEQRTQVADALYSSSCSVFRI